MKIRDSVAFVTGANRGLGLAFVQELLAAGAEGLRRGTRPKSITLAQATPASLDVTKPESVAAAARAFTDVNLLINNAGICLWSGFLAPSAIDVARTEMETNYFGPLLLTRAFAPILKQNGGGTIVNVLSFLSWVSIPDAGTYCASKSAAWALTNWLRTGLREQGPQVIGVHPGPMDTEMVSQLTLPKVKPIDVVRQAFSAIETGRDEVLPDEMTRQVKAALSNEPGIYLNFQRDLAGVA
jgi:NAD(P)-dependent dehydrogenase (short-subunit alcohol dehydrogenase family)